MKAGDAPAAWRAHANCLYLATPGGPFKLKRIPRCPSGYRAQYQQPTRTGNFHDWLSIPGRRLTSANPIPATASKLFLEERVEHCGPFAFEVLFMLETLLEQSFDSLQRLRPG